MKVGKAPLPDKAAHLSLLSLFLQVRKAPLPEKAARPSLFLQVGKAPLLDRPARPSLFLQGLCAPDQRCSGLYMCTGQDADEDNCAHLNVKADGMLLSGVPASEVIRASSL